MFFVVATYSGSKCAMASLTASLYPPLTF